MDLSAVIEAMDAVVLERIADGRFERRSSAPPWWHARARDNDQPPDGPLVVSDAFPFLEVFLPEAERVWSAVDPTPLASDLWTETDVGEHEIHLQAHAARVDGAAVLVIERADQAFFERQLLLQRARDLRVTYDALMRKIEREDVLLHTIVHDLAAPLQSIASSLDLLREIHLAAPAARWIELAAKAAARQRELIQGIMNVFVAEHGTDAADLGGVDLEHAIQRAVAEREPVARKRSVELVKYVTLTPPVAGDDTRLIRVLTNLLDNAIRHCPAGKTVRVTTAIEHDTVLLTVDDAGPGVPVQVVPRLFQKLARDPRGTGTGLGLYFCRITVEQWGGKIGYEARPTGGARFWIRLPLATARERSAAHG